MLNRSVAVVFALLAGTTVFRVASQAQSSPTNASPGLGVGMQAPTFALVGQDSHTHALTNLLAKGKLALVFQRSAHW